MREGEHLDEVRVTPDRWLPVRYAGASGDFNPIHIDAEYARAAGLPGPIMHGLYSMALVAKAATDAIGGDPRRLRRLQVEFRGMAFTEQEIVITGVVGPTDGGIAELHLEAAQDDRTIIRNASAVLSTD